MTRDKNDNKMQRQIKDLTQKYENLLKEISQLKQNYENFTIEIDQLKQERDDLKKSKEQLKKITSSGIWKAVGKTVLILVLITISYVFLKEFTTEKLSLLNNYNMNQFSRDVLWAGMFTILIRSIIFIILIWAIVKVGLYSSEE